MNDKCFNIYINILMALAIIGSSCFLVGSGYKLYKTKQQYDNLCKKISETEIYYWSSVNFNDNKMMNGLTEKKLIMRIEPSDVPNKKTFVGTINLTSIKEIPNIPKIYGNLPSHGYLLNHDYLQSYDYLATHNYSHVVRQKNDKNNIGPFICQTKINLQSFDISSFYGLECTGIEKIITSNKTLFLFDNISKSITYGSFRSIISDLENISQKQINTVITDTNLFAFEKQFISLNVPVYVYGTFTDDKRFSCEIISNHSNKIVKEIYKNEENNILLNFVIYTTTSLCSIACMCLFAK
jgi:hypothetical protein